MSNFANVCGLHMGHVFFCPAIINYALFQSASIPASGVCEHCATWQGNPPQSESLHQSHHGNSANQMNCSERMGSPSKKMISDWISGPKPIQTYSLWSSSPASLALPASSAFEDSPGGSALIELLTSDTPTAWLGAEFLPRQPANAPYLVTLNVLLQQIPWTITAIAWSKQHLNRKTQKLNFEHSKCPNVVLSVVHLWPRCLCLWRAPPASPR